MFRDAIPPSSLSLVSYSGAQVIDKLGKDIIANVVASILVGENLRNLTESLTQRRILLMNSGLLVTFLKALSSRENFMAEMSAIIANELNESKLTRDRAKKLSADERQYLLWFLGLTVKSVDNVTRGDEGISKYITELDANAASIAKTLEQTYGHIDLSVTLNKAKYSLQWPALLRCMLAMGAQTLSIRGSEKSIYGKLFEKLVLGSVLTILGGVYINKTDTNRDRMAFWLSENDDRRESDATLLLRPGIGVFFDIGFIGKGNPEAAMDKLTRYDNMLQHGRRRNVMSTIILIDTIGQTSRAKRIAEETGGFIIQMSKSFWVKELAEKIYEVDQTFDSPLLHMTNNDTINHIKEQVAAIDIAKFLSQADATST